MSSLSPLLSLLHLLGLVLGVGAGTVKMILLLKARADHGFLPVYVQASKPITRVIVFGLLVLTLSGLGHLFVGGGYPFTPGLIVKLFAVVALWGIGPVIDKVVEPKFQRLVPAPGQPPSPEFVQALKQYLALEAAANSVFYGITILWVLG